MIYHVTSQLQWLKAIDSGYFSEPSLEQEGFIHMSKLEQVAGVLSRYYKNQSNLVLLHVDENKVLAPLKYEHSPSVNEEFPHIYGTINLEAVIKVETLPDADQG